MLVDERSRRVLFESLESAIGAEAAEVMMAHLPPVGWADVATKQDLEHATDALRVAVETLGERITAEVAHTREVMEQRLKAEVSGVRKEIGDLRGETGRNQARQTQVFIAWNAMFFLGLVALIVNGVVG